MNYTVLNIPPGRRGTRETLRVMARLARDSQLVPIVRETALAIVGNVSWFDEEVKAKLVCDWVRANLRRMDEGVETLHRPEWLLGELRELRPIWGDCDDAALLISSLLMSVGIGSRYVAMARPGGAFEHVFVEGHCRGRWIMLDPFYSSIPAGRWVRMFQTVF